jgi:hypothetical protein
MPLMYGSALVMSTFAMVPSLGNRVCGVGT